MNYPTRQQRYARTGAAPLAILAAVLAQAGAAHAWTGAQLAGEDIAPVRLAQPWQASELRIRTGRIDPIWQSKRFEAPRMQSGRRVADVRMNRWPDAPEMVDIAVYMPRAALAAKAGRWDILAAQMQMSGIDANAVAQSAPEKPKDTPPMDASFGGELDPAWSADKLAEQIKKMHSFGFNIPIVPIRKISGNWRKDYDAFFAGLEGNVTPMLGLCIGKMDVPDLLAVPEFLRRYEGKYHSVVVNYDLTNGQVDGKSDSPAFRAASAKTSLALRLTHRAVPSSFVWLAVGYYRTPGWAQWIGAFDRLQFSGVLLRGDSAIAACMHPQVAKQVRKLMAKELGSTPLGLLDFRLHTLDGLLYRRDDLGIQHYTTIRASLKRVGIYPVHIRYTAGH